MTVNELLQQEIRIAIRILSSSVSNDTLNLVISSGALQLSIIILNRRLIAIKMGTRTVFESPHTYLEESVLMCFKRN